MTGKMIYKAYVNDLKRVYHGLYNNLTKSGSSVTLGPKGKKDRDEILKRLPEIIQLLEQIQ